MSTLENNELRLLEGQVLDWFSRTRPPTGTPRGLQLTKLLGFVRGGDTVVVHSMDGLARDLDDLRPVQGLTGRWLRVEFLKGTLVFTWDVSPMNIEEVVRFRPQNPCRRRQ